MPRGTLAVVLAGFVVAQPAAAQGFDWLFGEPSGKTSAASRHRVRSARQGRSLDIPLPVPRPHFPDDGAETAKTDTAAPSQQPTDTAGAPPMPPERPPPSDLVSTPPAVADEKRRASMEKAPASEASSVLERPATPKQADPATATFSQGSSSKPADGTTQATPAPAVAPSGATTAFNPRVPASDSGCGDRLKARGAVAAPTTLGPQPDARCTVMQPVRLVSVTLVDGTSVAFPDKPTVACTTADAFSAYVHDLLAPLAKGTWGVGLATVWTGPGLECRSRDHIFGAKLSAHGQGLAVDIAQLALKDGRVVAVGAPKTDTERDFETAARAGACGYFHTVLGPGSDSYHRTHWHFDLEVRGKEGDSKYCK